MKNIFFAGYDAGVSPTTIRPLETLHNSLSLKQMYDFMDRVIQVLARRLCCANSFAKCLKACCADPRWKCD